MDEMKEMYPVRIHEADQGAVVAMMGSPDSDRQPEDCCRGGLFLPDESYVPTTLSQVRKVFRAMRADARIGCVPGERTCCVASEELDGFTVFYPGRYNDTQRVPDKPVAAVPFETCLNPTCFGTLDKAGVCPVCGTAYLDGTEFVEVYEEGKVDLFD